MLAKVTDASGNPVADATVNFSQVSDPSGGRLQQASAVTDLNGVATVQYVSGAESTASGAVQLKGTVAGSTSVTGTALLTVNQSALFIALGTGNTISNFDNQTYEKNWSSTSPMPTGCA
ncbi:Ig-like domain-containing protein [Paucibacter sp. O1-1]|nr:Ig-like domain-containing protein [Paucibacter sp. O1-1]MDA3829925.1 Ig-like domain-containing protein [Paucibacter sp. O1-1]